MPRKCQILMLLTNPFEPDPRVYKEAKSLAAAGYQVTILAWDRQSLWPSWEQMDGFDIIRLQTRSTYGAGLKAAIDFFIFYVQVFRFIMRNRPEVLHCHDLDTAVIGWLAKILLRLPRFVYDAHEPDYYGHFPSLFKKAIDALEIRIARSAAVVFITSWIQQKKYGQRGIAQTVILRNTPDLGITQQQVERLASGYPVISRIGYIKPGTGIEALLEAAARLQTNYPQIKLLFIGKVFPAYEDEFTKFLQKFSQIALHIPFVPYPRVVGYYAHCDIGVMLYGDSPEFRLVTPTKLFEAMAFGKPVLISPVGDVAEILEHYPCGVIVPELTPEAIYQALEELLADKERLKKYGQIGREAFVKEFNWDLMEKRLLAAYQNLSNE